MTALIDAVKLAVVAILGAFVVYVYAQAIMLPVARSEARDRLIAEQAVEAQRLELERKGDDAKIQKLTDYDLCVSYLGRVSACDSLKVHGVCQGESIASGNDCPNPD